MSITIESDFIVRLSRSCRATSDEYDEDKQSQETEQFVNIELKHSWFFGGKCKICACHYMANS